MYLWYGMVQMSLNYNNSISHWLFHYGHHLDNFNWTTLLIIISYMTPLWTSTPTCDPTLTIMDIYSISPSI